MKKKISNHPLFVPIIALSLIVITGIGFAVYQVMSRSEPKPNIPQEQPAVVEARALGEAYIVALSACDRAKMDSYRTIPITNAKFASCKPVRNPIKVDSLQNYDKQYNDTLKENMETAIFKLTEVADNKSYGGLYLLSLVRYPDSDKTWKVMAP